MSNPQNFRGRVPPSRMPLGGAPIKHSSLIGSNRPELLAAGRGNLLKPQQPVNTFVPQYTAQSSESEKTEEKQLVMPESTVDEPEVEKADLVHETEEPHMKPKKQFSESRRPEDENEDEGELAEDDNHTAQGLLTLSQSLKAMKSLRDNFKSFEYGMEEDQDQQNQYDRAYREVDEEDYVKVESDEQIREDDEYEEQYQELEQDEQEEVDYEQTQARSLEQDYRRPSRSIRDQYIEEIHEKSQREEEDDEEENREEERRATENYDEDPELNTGDLQVDPEENLYIGQGSAQVSSAINDPEEPRNREEDITTTNIERVSTSAQRRVQDDKDRFLDEFEYGNDQPAESEKDDVLSLPKVAGSLTASPFGSSVIKPKSPAVRPGTASSSLGTSLVQAKSPALQQPSPSVKSQMGVSQMGSAAIKPKSPAVTPGLSSSLAAPIVQSKSPAVTPGLSSSLAAPIVQSKSPAVTPGLAHSLVTPIVQPKSPAVQLKSPAPQLETMASPFTAPKVQSDFIASPFVAPVVQPKSPSIHQQSPAVQLKSSALQSETMASPFVAPVLQSDTIASPFVAPIVQPKSPAVQLKSPAPQLETVASPFVAPVLQPKSPAYQQSPAINPEVGASPFGHQGIKSKSLAESQEAIRISNNGPFGTKAPFVLSTHQEGPVHPVQSPYRQEVTTPLRQSRLVSEQTDNEHLIKLKQIEIELAKERKRVECLEAERETLLTENKTLKLENAEVKANVEDLKRNRDVSKLGHRDQDAILKLREELKNTVENSRLIAEHSNRVIDENVKYKQDMENIVAALETERDQLQQSITELNNSLRSERLKIENLQQRADFSERKAQEYEESFDLIQRQLKDRMEAFQKLVSLNEEAQVTLHGLPKVEELIAKLQPVNQTISVQTSQIISPYKAASRGIKDEYPSFEKGAAFNKSQSSARVSEPVEDNSIRISQQNVEKSVQRSQPSVEPLVLNSQMTNASNKVPTFKQKTSIANVESAVSLDHALQKDVSSLRSEKSNSGLRSEKSNSGLRSEKNVSIKSDTEFVFSPNFNQTYSKLTSSVLTEDAREEGKKYKSYDPEDDLSLLVGNQTLLDMVATPQTAKPNKKDPFKIEDIVAQKERSLDTESPIIRKETTQELAIKKPPPMMPNFGNKSTPKIVTIKKEVIPEEIPISVPTSAQNLEDTIRNRNPMMENSGDWGLEDSVIGASPFNRVLQKDAEKTKQPSFGGQKQLEVATQPKSITFSQAAPSPKIETPKAVVPQVAKTESTAPKPVFSLPPGKSKVPSFVKQPSTEESKSKDLFINKTVSGSQEKVSTASDKLNLGSSQNKGGMRYAQPKKTIEKTSITAEADNFFDELGLSDMSMAKGVDPFKTVNSLRESTTSIKANTNRQSQTLVKKKL